MKIVRNRKFGIGGGTTNIHPAMLQDDLDMYVEYTRTAFMNVLNQKSGNRIVFSDLQKFNLKRVGLLGFNNTYALAISKKNAKEKNIKTYSDLVLKSSKFEFGTEFDFFECNDTYKGLIKIYPLSICKTTRNGY